MIANKAGEESKLKRKYREIEHEKRKIEWNEIKIKRDKNYVEWEKRANKIEIWTFIVVVATFIATVVGLFIKWLNIDEKNYSSTLKALRNSSENLRSVFSLL